MDFKRRTFDHNNLNAELQRDILDVSQSLGLFNAEMGSNKGNKGLGTVQKLAEQRLRTQVKEYRFVKFESDAKSGITVHLSK